MCEGAISSSPSATAGPESGNPGGSNKARRSGRSQGHGQGPRLESTAVTMRFTVSVREAVYEALKLNVYAAFLEKP